MAVPGKALLCDFDGTLADSLGLLKTAYASFLGRFGIPSSDAEFDEMNGPPLAEIVSILRRRHGFAAGQDEALALYNQEIAAAWPTLRPSHGARFLLQTARDAGWRTGIVTSNDRGRVEDWLGAVGLADLVECVIGGGEGPGKPDPGPYLAALRRLESEASLSLAVEDSPAGSRAAVDAGLRTLFYAPLDRPGPPAGLERAVSLTGLAPLLSGADEDLAVRLAEEADRPFLYGLRNDPAAIAVSRTPRRLSEAELAERFRPDPSLRDKVTMIVQQAGRPAAMVRFDRDEALYRISIVVAEEWRGRGIGQRALRLACDAFLAMKGSVALEAEVAEDNMASAQLFRRAGFREEGRRGRFLRFIRNDLGT